MKSVGGKFMMEDVKYFYLFRPNLDTHIQFYYGWVSAARSRNLDVELITFLPLTYWMKKRDKISELKKLYTDIRIIPILPGDRFLGMTFFFLYQKLIYKRIVVHLKKVNPFPVFWMLKKISRNIKIVVDLEGDFESERDYLINNPYKQGFYNEVIEAYDKNIVRQKRLIEFADTVTCVNENFRKLLVERFDTQKDKFEVLPTGVDTSNFYFELEERMMLRKKLKIEDKFVLIFSGNLFYSWQNLSKALELFSQLIKLNQDVFFIILTRKQDFFIAEEFIKKYEIEDKFFLIDNVSNSDVRKYLNASDLGVLLRKDHIMNRVASPGKVGEYVSCGLKLLITKATTFFSDELEKTGQAIIVNDLEDSKMILCKLNRYIKEFFNETNNIEWREAINNSIFYSNESYRDIYSNILIKTSKK